MMTTNYINQNERFLHWAMVVIRSIEKIQHLQGQSMYYCRILYLL